ncbi:MAG TPA: hypothetical protein VMU48_19360 [Terracidiphilus sp.]|nr:hypothetical protein [Terracidiphilus sp.]
MRFDWPAKTMIALSAVSVAAYWIGHRWLWVLQVAAILVAVAFLAILFFVRKRTPKRNIVAFWLIPCTWTGLWFLNESIEKPGGMMSVLTGILFALNLFVFWGNLRLGRQPSHSI